MKLDDAYERQITTPGLVPRKRVESRAQVTESVCLPEFGEMCDVTEADAQEATVRACHTVNPGIIVVGIPRTASSSHF